MELFDCFYDLFLISDFWQCDKGNYCLSWLFHSYTFPLLICVYSVMQFPFRGFFNHEKLQSVFVSVPCRAQMITGYINHMDIWYFSYFIYCFRCRNLFSSCPHSFSFPFKGSIISFKTLNRYLQLLLFLRVILLLVNRQVLVGLFCKPHNSCVKVFLTFLHLFNKNDFHQTANWQKIIIVRRKVKKLQLLTQNILKL